jgi:hypothetical protein
VALWVVFGFVLWNAIFDSAVLRGALDYLIGLHLFQQEHGPVVTIHGVMDEAVARGAQRATAIGGGVCAIGLVLVWLASRRRARLLPGRAEQARFELR